MFTCTVSYRCFKSGLPTKVANLGIPPTRMFRYISWLGSYCPTPLLSLNVRTFLLHNSALWNRQPLKNSLARGVVDSTRGTWIRSLARISITVMHLYPAACSPIAFSRYLKINWLLLYEGTLIKPDIQMDTLVPYLRFTLVNRDKTSGVHTGRSFSATATLRLSEKCHKLVHI